MLGGQGGLPEVLVLEGGGQGIPGVSWLARPDCVGEPWAHLRDPASVNKMEGNQGRSPPVPAFLSK